MGCKFMYLDIRLDIRDKQQVLPVLGRVKEAEANVVLQMEVE